MEVRLCQSDGLTFADLRCARGQPLRRMLEQLNVTGVGAMSASMSRALFASNCRCTTDSGVLLWVTASDAFVSI